MNSFSSSFKLFCNRGRLQIKIATLRYSYTTSSKKLVKLSIEPNGCLQDEPVNISANGLDPYEFVTLTSSLKDSRDRTFFSHSYYIANLDGCIDLNKNKSLGGSHEGLFPMGPIANLLPSPLEEKYNRYVKRDVQIPSNIRFSLLKGHLSAKDAITAGADLNIATTEHLRHYMAPGVARIPVRVGRIRGTLFMPAGEGPFPGVIDLFGSSGGLVEFRAAQLASRGVAALSLAFFGYDDLPEALDMKDLAYFEEAVHFLRDQDKIMKPHIGVVGVSIGGEIACAMGCYIDCVKAVVCINGWPVNTWCPLIVNGKEMPCVTFDVENVKFLEPDLICTLDTLEATDRPETHFPLHESDADFLFHASLDDENYKTEDAVDEMKKRMEEKGYSRFKVMKYPGAGHLLEPPYSPFCAASYFKMARNGLCWGGSALPHTEASMIAWNETISFIKEKLTSK